LNLKGPATKIVTLALLIMPLFTCSGNSGDEVNLSGLTISAGTLSPTFDKDTTTYAVRVPITTYSVTFTPTAIAGVNSLITINDLPVISEKESGPVVLFAGMNAVTIKVKSPNREKEKIYTVNITKSISDLEAVIQGNDTDTDDKFGWSVACDGTTLVVGAPGAAATPGGGPAPGAVYIFSKNTAGTWEQTQKLMALDATDGDNFGWSVALYENTIAVGAPYRDHDGTDIDSGGIYLFTKSGNTWTERTMKESSGPCREYYFGWSVSLSGGTLAVGEPDCSDVGLACLHAGGGYYGAVHIFTGSGASWTHQAKLQASDAAGNIWFGDSISLDGGTLAVGASAKTSLPALVSGAVYIFTGASASWTEQVKLMAAIPYANNNFGASVSLSSGRLGVGAPTDSSSVLYNGATYLFAGSGAVWQQAGDSMKSTTPVANDYLGSSVSVKGDLFVAGAAGSPNPVYGRGFALVYAKQEFFVWEPVESALIPAGAEASLARFGQSIAVTDSEIFVGANNYDLDASGAVYIYH
jgi:hypothetical protein